MSQPKEFPPLPHGFDWTPNVLRAYNMVSAAYYGASVLLRQEEPDPVRLRVHSETICGRMVSILQDLVNTIGQYEWAHTAATALGEVAADLEKSAADAERVCVLTYHTQVLY